MPITDNGAAQRTTTWDRECVICAAKWLEADDGEKCPKCENPAQQTTGTSGFVGHVLDQMTQEEREAFFRLCRQAEEPCALCGWVILAGGCPGARADCPGYGVQAP